MTLDAVSTPFETVARMVRAWTNILIWICGALFCVAISCLVAEVATRFAFHSSIRGVQEIVGLFFLYGFFLGAAALYARNEDVSLTFFIRALPTERRALIACVVALIICTSMSVVAYEATFLMIAQATIYSADLQISESFRFAPLALAAASIAATSLIDAWANVIWMRSGSKPSVWKREGVPEAG
jgi:TRAP-type C4-dicarboxylate transport system permease small subunit